MQKAGHLLLFLLVCLCGACQAPGPLLVPQLTRVWVPLGENLVPVQLRQYGEQPDPVLIHLHDDEPTALEAAEKLLEQRGGLLVKLENNGERILGFTIDRKLYRIDPNRIFSSAGITFSLTQFGRSSNKAMEATARFASRLLALVPVDASCIIALHNNRDGGFSVLSYGPNGELAQDAREVIIVPGEDPDDFFLTTDSLLFKGLAPAGYNIVWQHNASVVEDGSLSVYYGRRGRRYLNCETEHGKNEQYEKMLLQVWDWLDRQKDQ